MIYIFTALSVEAKPIISKYQLKKDSGFHHFQVFGNDDMILTVTGTGAVRAAMAVTEVCIRIPPNSCDFMINMGVCGVRDDCTSVGDCFVVNKITDDTTERDFYPDMIYETGLPERSLRTVALPAYVDNTLMDMEGSGLFEASAMFFSADRMIFIKTVSDNGRAANIVDAVGDDDTAAGANGADTAGTADSDISSVTADKVEKLMGALLDKVSGLLDGLHNVSGELPGVNGGDSNQGLNGRIEKLAEDMKLSVTMAAAFKQLLRYLELEGADIEGLIDKVYSEYRLPVKSKKEGKKIYDGIYETVFTHLR